MEFFLKFFFLHSRCRQFICSHYYVHLLFTGRHGSAVSKIFMVEEIYNKYADGMMMIDYDELNYEFLMKKI